METSLKKIVLKASSFTVLSYGVSQVLRFGSNLVLTRLLAPELFGLVATAQILVAALALFTDIGLEPSIIRSARSNESAFLNSAWTLQIIRNSIITVLTFGIAIPASIFYKEPLLIPLMSLVGFSSLISGFESTSLRILAKEMDQKALMIIELTVQIISLTCMILAAFYFRNIWALLVGDIIGPIIRVAWSHLINKKNPNKIVLEKTSVQELLSFGKWILVSTAIMFISSQIDRIIFGKLLGMAWFGVYNIALSLSELPQNVVYQLGSKIVLPLVSKYIHLPHDEIRRKLEIPRRRFLIPAAVLIALLTCSGDYIIAFLYDDRYRIASWIFPLLVFGSWPHILILTVESCLLALGKPKYSAVGNFCRFVYLIVALPLSYKLGGQLGAVIAVSINAILPFIVFNIGLKKEKLSFLKQDFLMTFLFLGATCVFTGIRIIAGLGIPGQVFFK